MLYQRLPPSAPAPVGAGIGLRTRHVPEVLRQAPQVPWFELLADNWLVEGGLTRRYLDAISERYPLTLHGVGLSLGGSDALDWHYLNRIKVLKSRSRAVWYSEHACFSHHDGHYFHDLCPLPMTEETVAHLARRIRQVQDFLGERILLENVSSYVSYQESTFSEGTFLAAVAEAADCNLLVDINNLYVNEYNHGQDAGQVLRQLPAARVREIHLAGYQEKEGYLLDAHNHPVSEQVWALYEQALQLWGQVPTLIEWDHELPDWSTLVREQQRASECMQRITSPAEAVCP